MNNRDTLIYKAYLQVKAEPGKKVKDLLVRFKISRQALYDAVWRVQRGNPAGVKRAVEKARLEAVWEEKYKARYGVIPRDRRASTVAELKRLIRAMRKDRFTPTLIAKKLGKDKSSVRHHFV